MKLGHLLWNSDADRLASCVGDDDLALTRGEFLDRVTAFAEQLAEHGFARGDVLAVMLPNRVELLVAILAAWRLGGAATPVNPAFTDVEAGYQIRDSGAGFVLNVGPDAPDGGRPAIHVDLMRRQGSGPTTDPVPVTGSDLALVIYTSGSTGHPKGVMLDHANVDAMSDTMGQHLSLTSDDHCMLVLPLFHANALMVSAFAVLRVGGRLSIIPGFSAGRFWADVERLRPTYFSAVPTIYAILAAMPDDVRPDTSSLRFVVCGAAPVSAELLETVTRRFGFTLIEGYGLTEGTCASACNPIDGVRKLGTVGPALPGQEIRIQRPDGTWADPGENGEVLISGPVVMRGYLGRPEATAETVVDGWLHTGDVGQLDEDGYLTLVDRIKDLIIRGGENIYPKEIEATLAAVPGVLEAAVVGRPDDVLGEVPVAYVTVYPDSDVTAEQLIDHCRRHLTRVKVPETIHLVESLPKNPVGKIDKPGLRARLQASRS
jgi:acyl-CoA synthetase (AMP-forming)/AMP-acid ligase II